MRQCWFTFFPQYFQKPFAQETLSTETVWEKVINVFGVQIVASFRKKKKYKNAVKEIYHVSKNIKHHTNFIEFHLNIDETERHTNL